MGFWSGLGSMLGAAGSIAAIPFTGGASATLLPAILGAGGAVAGGLGSALGGASQAKASNRGTAFEGQMDLARLLMQRDNTYWDQQYRAGQGDFENRMSLANTGFNQQLAREQEGRAGRNDAWRGLVGADRVLNPIAAPNVSPYQIGPAQASPTMRQGADALTKEVMARLVGGNPITLSELPSAPSLPTPVRGEYNIDPSLLSAGKGESTMGWLGAGLQAYSNAQRPQYPYPYPAPDPLKQPYKGPVAYPRSPGLVG